eukprot:scaffold80165_cov63-Cyclotella_meneghiniana.AAC.2
MEFVRMHAPNSHLPYDQFHAISTIVPSYPYNRYHQVKFIERQKLTRLEKSIQRQITQLQEKPSEGSRTTQQIEELQEQLKTIALNQLYVAYYPPDMKYMSLFSAEGSTRDRKRRREVWDRIRMSLLSVQEDKETKHWVNLDVAKKALLEMDKDTYPKAPPLLNRDAAAGGGGGDPESRAKAIQNSKDTTNIKKSMDNRFVLSKEVDEMFVESTTGNDYQQMLSANNDKGSNEGSSSDSSSESSTDTSLDRKDDDSSSDSETESATQQSQSNKPDNDEPSDDDFFTTVKVSAEEVFAQAEVQQRKSIDHYDDLKKRSDKSKGFSTQNQTKREFRNFQHKKKRSRLG